jgi:hypothetical protein
VFSPIAWSLLLKSSEVRAQLRFKGGATHTLTLPLPKSAWMLRQTPETVVTEINRLLDDHTASFHKGEMRCPTSSML